MAHESISDPWFPSGVFDVEEVTDGWDDFVTLIRSHALLPCGVVPQQETFGRFCNSLRQAIGAYRGWHNAVAQQTAPEIAEAPDYPLRALALDVADAVHNDLGLEPKLSRKKSPYRRVLVFVVEYAQGKPAFSVGAWEDTKALARIGRRDWRRNLPREQPVQDK